MTEKIKELRDFYLLDDKLLYVSKEFIGFDPLISKGMSYERTEKPGTKMKLDELEIGEFLFNVLLIQSFNYGPISGHKRIDIFRGGKTIISHEHGGKMCWNYTKGNDFYLENNSAFLVKDGNAMRYGLTRKIYRDFIENKEYILYFSSIIIPEEGKTQEQMVREFIWNMNILKFKSVTEFHDAIRDSEYTAPPEMYRCLVKLMGQRGFTFPEAYNFLWERRLIFISGNFYFYDLKADRLLE